jgi:lysine N6-hydroxylase
MNTYDLIGIGLGPFNLSLLSLASKTKLSKLFLEKNPHFNWHPEISFEDSLMQTSFYKDLVTSVDPTSPYTFLNYLVQNGLFYTFMNTGRSVVTRKEFENYLKWASHLLSNQINFNQEVIEVDYKNNLFHLSTETQKYTAKNLSLGTGITPKIPSFATSVLGKNVFHAKSKELATLDVTGKKIAIIGGGQTGIEIFRNILNNKFGNFQSLKLISSRPNLQPLDESPFTNEYFTPNYSQCFFGLEQEDKDQIVQAQKLASDGNTPQYLEWLYNDLYQKKYVYNDQREIELRPNRKVEAIEQTADYLEVKYFNSFTKKTEVTKVDVIILATGFNTTIPKSINKIRHLIPTDKLGRFEFNRDFSINWEFQATNKIFGMNLSRHGHGISDPQTSLMPYRSATIINSILNEDTYQLNLSRKNFVNFCREDNE